MNTDQVEKANCVLSTGLQLERWISALYSLLMFYFLENATPKSGKRLFMASENKPLSRVDGDLKGLRNYGGSGHLEISKASQGSVSVVGTFIL